MRRVGALALLLVLSGCAGCAARTDGSGVATADGKPAATASSAPAAQNDRDAQLKFSQCMRDQGMTWFPDPKPGSPGLQIRVPQGTDKAKMDAAMAACKKYMPNGGEPPKPDGAMLEQMRQMSKCMRENGVPHFPDPKANGQIELNAGKLGGVGPGDPTFDAAQKKCEKYAPKPAGGGSGQNTVRG
jgi:hypothetical protein